VWSAGIREGAGEAKFHAAGAVAGLCAQAKASPADFAQQLVAAGLDKGWLVAAAAAMGTGSGSKWGGGKLGGGGGYRLNKLLKDTELLSTLAAAEKAVVEAEAAAEEAAHPITEEGSKELVHARFSRCMHTDLVPSWGPGLQNQEAHAASENHAGSAWIAAADSDQDATSRTFYRDCTLHIAAGAQPLADVLSQHVLTCRKHWHATAGMGRHPSDKHSGTVVACDCSSYVAEFRGTNRPRSEATGDVQPWRCSNCKASLPKERAELEEATKVKAEHEDTAVSGGNKLAHARRLHGFGLRVEFLVAVTVAFDCWIWPTWKVQRDIIRPLCREGHCRFAELPWVASHTGPADIFISHTWGAQVRFRICRLGVMFTWSVRKQNLNSASRAVANVGGRGPRWRSGWSVGLDRQRCGPAVRW
jgi:hypothetical protein